ncbi:uncharacterized protein LOC128725212 [Anopheles nili]|uniref:uncharacterized protein LOC128725212 n=1 Tax=Anopheles nili TaxID=185578 RepID=UPI00237A33BF|nr:uncharacterized protein LOC128725212 [Anopheles nili]
MDGLDASEILNHLNHLGYRNITVAQLKEFQSDLKKLIKFDTKLNAEEECRDPKVASNEENVFERLYDKKTASFQAKSSRPSKQIQTTTCLISDKENQTTNHKQATNIKSKMWIRPKSSQMMRRGDPVALYHSYQNDWNKFKQNLPGENDHSELRWKIRSKLLGEKT